MCAAQTSRRSRLGAIVAVVSLVVLASACGGPERSGSSFCRQLGRELPGIGQPMATTRDVESTIGRWERLLERAPLTIEKDIATLADLLRKAAAVDPANPDEVQDLADTSYESKQAADAVRDWVLDTCAVDISTGLTVAPPRTAPPTTVTADTTAVPVDTTMTPTPDTVPSTSVAPVTATTLAP